MSRITILLTCLVCLAPLSWVLPLKYLTALTLAAGFPHVILGLKYSRRGLERAWRSPRPRLALLVFMGLTPVTFAAEWNVEILVIYFGIHHAISEVYSRGPSVSGESRINRGIYWLLIFAGYLFASRDDLSFIPNLPVLSLAIFGILLALLIYRIFDSTGNSDNFSGLKCIIERYPWIFAASLLVAISCYSPLSWQVFILYHFTYWGLLPLFRTSVFRGDTEREQIFWKDNLLWTSGFTLTIVAVCLICRHERDWRVFSAIVLLFHSLTYFHISISFLISGANPSWIKRLV